MKHKIKITFNAPVTLSFVCICFVVTLAGMMTAGQSTKFLFTTYRSSLGNPLMYIRLFTHVFGHAGWEHFIGNASYLLLLGPMLEEKHGSKEMLITIVLTALITGVVNNIFFGNTGLLGASGVVFAFILLSSFTGFTEGEIPLTFILVALVFLGQQVYEGIFVKDNIANLTHILGGVVGAVLGYIQNRKSRTAF